MFFRVLIAVSMIFFASPCVFAIVASNAIERYLSDRLTPTQIAQTLVANPTEFEADVKNLASQVSARKAVGQLSSLEVEKIRVLSAEISKAAKDYNEANEDTIRKKIYLGIGGAVIGAVVVTGTARYFTKNWSNSQNMLFQKFGSSLSWGVSLMSGAAAGGLGYWVTSQAGSMIYDINTKIDVLE